ncbi:hypothetical protein [Streptomyces sp. HUAS ZL42]|uniref:hypothetical protein n=1 Tax=Streptomyces sp. HUAS ZL42 TaxID=3231715 RepID=UPI00345E567E
MTRSRAALVASVLSTSALLTATACSGLTADRPPKTPAGTASPSAGPVLTDAQVHAALITEADLGAPWIPTRGIATWRDGLLKAAVDARGTATAPDCQRLLDGLYTDEFLGTPPRAVITLDDADTDAQLRYQVTEQRPADTDRTLAWLRTLPTKCARFTATTAGGTVQDVAVADAPLPEVGDARQGLRVTLTGETADGEYTVLTLDVAAVRVGEDTIGLTHGSLGDVSFDATQAFVQLGAQRLTDVRKQGRVQV